MLVEVAGVEPGLAFHEFALIYISSYLKATCGLIEMRTNESRCILMFKDWQIIGKSK